MAAKTLAELRQAKSQAKGKSLPTRVVKVCLDHEVIADAQRLEAEKNALLVESNRRRVEDDDEAGPPKRMGESVPPRVAEIDAELETLWDRMRDSEGDLLLSAIPGGEWQRWKDENPAREDNKSDEQMTFGVCNALALLEDLGRYVKAYQDEPLADDDWDNWLADSIAPADLRDLVTTVVEMHEARITIPKSSPASSTTADSEPA